MHGEVNGVKLHYHDEGAGLPILFVHGFPLTGAMWDQQRSALAEGYRVIVPDLRGFGESDAPEGSLSMDQQADDLAALLDTLGVGRAVVCGLSMGGYIALALARRYPSRLAGLVLANTRAGAESEEGRQGRDQMVKLAREQGVAAVAEKMLPKMFAAATYRDRPELVAQLRQMMSSVPLNGVVGALLGMRDRPDATSLLDEIEAPTMVVTGAEDAIIPLAEAEKLQHHIPNARLEVLARAGHLSNLEQPQAFNQALRDFLESCA